MKSIEVRKAVEERLLSHPGIIDTRFLDTELKSKVIEIETAAEKNGACGGLMPFVNSGVWKALDRDACVVVIIKSRELLLDDTGIVYIADQKGQVVGEYLSPRRRKEVRESRPDASFLSEDFCLYGNVKIEGEPYFVIAPMSFPLIEDVPGVVDVVSGSISTMADEVVRKEMGHPGVNKWSHLIGFNYAKDVEKTEEEKKRPRVVPPPLLSKGSF